jgi:hypothetical protein
MYFIFNKTVRCRIMFFSMELFDVYSKENPGTDAVIFFSEEPLLTFLVGICKTAYLLLL